MVALNVQCSMFNGESFLQLPRRVAVSATIAALVVATLGDGGGGNNNPPGELEE